VEQLHSALGALGRQKQALLATVGACAGAWEAQQAQARGGPGAPRNGVLPGDEARFVMAALALYVEPAAWEGIPLGLVRSMHAALRLADAHGAAAARAAQLQRAVRGPGPACEARGACVLCERPRRSGARMLS